MEVRNHHGDIAKLVFIDTRTKPNFVWVQPADNGEDDEWSWQVAHFVEDWISREAYAYGWKAKLKRSGVFNKLVYWPQFDSAMAYVDAYLKRTLEFCLVYSIRGKN